MNGLELVSAALRRDCQPSRLPVMPIIHTGLAHMAGVPLGQFFSDATVMARVTVQGSRKFKFDGVQLSAGVTSEAEALGATVEQPADAAPLLKTHLLDHLPLSELRGRDPVSGGRMPLFFDATRQVVEEIGGETFVLPTLRGPLLMASQLLGVEPLLMALIDCPEKIEEMLDFTVGVALRLGSALHETGAHGLVLGEATCSPNFISPEMYRTIILPFHVRLVAGLKAAGWKFVGLHICGNIHPILEDVILTGIDFVDVDYQVSPVEAIRQVQGRIALRGNLDPARLFRFGTPDQVRDETKALCGTVCNIPWIMSSGCDIPPGTPVKNLEAFIETVHDEAEENLSSP